MGNLYIQLRHNCMQCKPWNGSLYFFEIVYYTCTLADRKNRKLKIYLIHYMVPPLSLWGNTYTGIMMQVTKMGKFTIISSLYHLKYYIISHYHFVNYSIQCLGKDITTVLKGRCWSTNGVWHFKLFFYLCSTDPLDILCHFMYFSPKGYSIFKTCLG